MTRPRVQVLAAAGLAAAVALVSAPAAAGAARGPAVTVVAYDSFDDADGYTESDYLAKWSTPYGPGEMAAGGTRSWADGSFVADATPFRTSYDFSVYDHIKYLAISNESFAVPQRGSITFSMGITAQTPGTQDGRVVRGTYTATGAPYAAEVLQGQQAGATLHMIDFATGQLFDWFVSGNTAFTLVERLPATVLGHAGGGSRETMYTQIVDEVPITPGVRHDVAITFVRNAKGSSALWHLDGELVSRVDDVGVPLDVQGQDYTGTYPSLGPGELLADEVDDVVIGHGLFSLLDAFPFQHPDAPELAVSIPVSERIFGQGASARFDDVRVITVGR